jgi:paraquat-inducible protein B
MSASPAPKVTKGPTFPLIWVVPVVALAIAAWMTLKEIRDRGPLLTILFADGSGVEANKTTLEYMGVTAGKVESISLKPSLDGVIIRLRLHKNAEGLAKAGSRFWIVHPEIGFSGVRGLDTLVSGVRLNVIPGRGAPEKEFVGLDMTPPPYVRNEGRTFYLDAEKLGSLTSGSPVVYRELKVGSVEASRLSDDSTRVRIRIHIEEPYADLVRTSTRFWNSGGFTFKVSLLGAEVRDTSLESLVNGGVAFATPDSEPLAPVAKDGDVFALASDAEKEWVKWEPKIPVKAQENALETPPKGGLIPSLIK